MEDARMQPGARGYLTALLRRVFGWHRADRDEQGRASEEESGSRRIFLRGLGALIIAPPTLGSSLWIPSRSVVYMGGYVVPPRYDQIVAICLERIRPKVLEHISKENTFIKHMREYYKT